MRRIHDTETDRKVYNLLVKMIDNYKIRTPSDLMSPIVRHGLESTMFEVCKLIGWCQELK